MQFQFYVSPGGWFSCLLLLVLAILVKGKSLTTNENDEIRLDCGSPDPTLYTFTSPNHPNQYPSDTSEMWNISAPRGYRIGLISNIFTVADKGDHLDIRDLMNRTNDKLCTYPDKICGPFNSTGDILVLNFRSSADNEGIGFNMTAFCLKDDPTTTSSPPNFDATDPPTTSSPPNLAAIIAAIAGIVAMFAALAAVLLRKRWNRKNGTASTSTPTGNRVCGTAEDNDGSAEVHIPMVSKAGD